MLLARVRFIPLNLLWKPLTWKPLKLCFTASGFLTQPNGQSRLTIKNLRAQLRPFQHVQLLLSLLLPKEIMGMKIWRLLETDKPTKHSTAKAKRKGTPLK